MITLLGAFGLALGAPKCFFSIFNRFFLDICWIFVRLLGDFPCFSQGVGGMAEPLKSAASAEGGRWACGTVTDSCCTPFLALPKPCRHDTDPPLKNSPSSLVGNFFRFLLLSIRAPKMTSKNHRQKSENQGFWPPITLPKSIQNPFKIDVPQNMHFFIDFA